MVAPVPLSRANGEARALFVKCLDFSEERFESITS